MDDRRRMPGSVGVPFLANRNDIGRRRLHFR